LSWEHIEQLAAHLPNIEELYLAGNPLSDIRYCSTSSARRSHFQQLSKLRILDLCGCEVSQWQKVLYLNLPSLQELALDSNPIDEINSCPPEAFPSLQRLSLSATKLSNWSDVDMIATYPAIRQLRLSQIPLFSGKGASEVRPKIIARIKKLNFFNGSGISERERTDAEKSYLRTIMRELQDNKDIAAVESLHPRFKELQATYGSDLLPLERTHDNLTLAADMITVTFHNFTFSSGGSLEPLTKKIPSSVTIARLRMMIKQMFGLDIKLQLLSLRVYKDSPPLVLDDDQSSLQYYGAIDGAEIFINEA
jgi:Leucine-rich repeat (LRR) protein